MFNQYEVGEVVKVKVTGISSYGFFVSIDEDINGLIHISEISSSFVRNIGDYVTIGESILAEIISIDEVSHQFCLSIKNLNYRIENSMRKQEEAKGFRPLKDSLPIWTEEKLEEMKND